jgi:hypothetical protein
MRVGTQFRHELHRILFMHQAVHFAGGVVQVPKNPRPLMARTDAVRFLVLPYKVLAEGTLLHYPQFPVQGTGTVRAGHDAGFTADTFFLIHQHDTIGTLRRSPRRTTTDAGRVIAMETGARDMIITQRRVPSGRAYGGNLVPEHAYGQFIPDLAGNGAGMATDAAP